MKASHFLTVLLLLVCVCGFSYAATGYGHFILARETIRTGNAAFPPELKAVIADPECQNAFCGGAVAPDICENFSHYGNTGDAVNAMLTSAREHVAAAQQAGDATALKAAQKELAFSYGWLTHCAVDLEVHPAVNALPTVGDAFKYLDDAHQVSHGAAEVQLDDYLKKTYKQPEDKWAEQLSVPFEFLAANSKMSEGDLRNAWRVSNLKNTAGIAWTQNVNIDTAPIWADIVKASLDGSQTLLRDPNQFQNWDLCAGRISTLEFDALRAYQMSLNGGKLPDGWGKNYLQIAATSRNEWAKYEDQSRRVNHNLPVLPQLNLDTAIAQINEWLAACLKKLEEDKANDPARIANRDACLAYAERIHAGGDKLYCRGCKAVLAQYWCPNDPDLGDHWMCGCSGVTQLSMLLRPDGRTFNSYATERIAAVDALANELRALAEKMKTDGFQNNQRRADIEKFLACANGGGFPAPAGSQPATNATAPATTSPQANTAQAGNSGGTPAGNNSINRLGGAPAPPAANVVRNEKYGYSLTIPQGWREDKEGLDQETVQRFRRNDTGTTLVEVKRVEAPKLSVDQLRQVATQLMQGNNALKAKVAEAAPEAASGNVLVVTYTGVINNLPTRTVARFVSTDGVLYVIGGTTTKTSGQDEWVALRTLVASFQGGK
jgi:stage V sporulation protein SpoVS